MNALLFGDSSLTFQQFLEKLLPWKMEMMDVALVEKLMPQILVQMTPLSYTCYLSRFPVPSALFSETYAYAMTFHKAWVHVNSSDFTPTMTEQITIDGMIKEINFHTFTYTFI